MVRKMSQGSISGYSGDNRGGRRSELSGPVPGNPDMPSAFVRPKPAMEKDEKKAGLPPAGPP